jgi:hypothetical protein
MCEQIERDLPEREVRDFQAAQTKENPIGGIIQGLYVFCSI